ncbi:phage tail sheath family protein [Serratia proteamaculans]
MTVTSYPGVYIEELESLALSVSSNATAVPVFAISDTDTFFPTTTRISSWMDYLIYVGVPVFDDLVNVRDACIRTYFDNGGGYCYLVPVGDLLAELPKLDDATLVVAAGQVIPGTVLTLCGEGNKLFAILDGPVYDILDHTWTSTSSATAYAALYYPWLTASWAVTADSAAEPIPIPPSAAVAGLYCVNDRTRGVWKAPANIALKGGVSPLFNISDELQGDYTSGDLTTLNMIRRFNNGSPLVWGARTSLDTDEWRYISVRRLFNSAERDIQHTMQSVMFEPNSQPTWERVRSAITNYLYSLWKQGGLSGAKPEEAFFVQIGKDITMTEEDINAGKMIVQVGMAAVRPAEFIILQFTQDVTQ